MAGIGAMYSFMRFFGKGASPIATGDGALFADRHPVAPMAAAHDMPSSNNPNPLHANASALTDPRAVP